MEREYHVLRWTQMSNYINYGKRELAFLLNDERFLIYRNPNNKFKKHLGFTVGWHKIHNEITKKHSYESRLTIFDHKKLMLFKIKYGL